MNRGAFENTHFLVSRSIKKNISYPLTVYLFAARAAGKLFGRISLVFLTICATKVNDLVHAKGTDERNEVGVHSDV
jgi:hypothetical protein